jgi:diacylglycerol kinase (ATP)
MKEPYFDKAANTGVKHLLNATRFSLQGLKSAALRESAFRQELFFAVPVLLSGAYFAASWLHFLFLLGAVLLVLIVELLNSGIEAAVDRTGTEHNELAGLAKDYGSAAVMLTLLLAGAVWLTIIARGLF